MVVDEETEVRRARRSWPVQYKLDILAEIDEAKARGEPGAVGAICKHYADGHGRLHLAERGHYRACVIVQPDAPGHPSPSAETSP